METYGNGKPEMGVGLLEGEAQETANPDPEVSSKSVRRKYTAEYKRRILREAERCTKKGEIGALLRREGLYSSVLTTWRQARERRELEALSPKKRGRKAKPVNPLSQRVHDLEKKNRQLEKKLKQSELVIDLQKKVLQMAESQAPETGGVGE
jgi:transposase-like protein